MGSWMHNNAKDVKTEVNNTFRASFVKLENNNEKYAMAQSTKVSRCISLKFLIVPEKGNYSDMLIGLSIVILCIITIKITAEGAEVRRDASSLRAPPRTRRLNSLPGPCCVPGQAVLV